MAALDLPDTSLVADDAVEPAPAARGQVAQLFRTHARRVQEFLTYRLKNQDDAQDATQDVFLRLWRHEADGSLRKTATESTNYMYSATQSVAIDIDRQRQRRGQRTDGNADLDALPAAGAGPDETSDWRNAAACFVDGVQALPEMTRRVAVLFHFKGQDYDEIAAQLGVSRRTVERHVTRGLARLRERMKDYL
jgi:RNA polymerase sigma-70 factor (ECF subfamily)